MSSCTCVWSPSGDRLKGLAQARDPGRGRLGKHLPLVGALARGGSGRWGQMVNDNGEKSTLAERLKDKGLSFDAPTGGPVSLGDIPSGQGHAALAAGGTLGFKEKTAKLLDSGHVPLGTSEVECRQPFTPLASQGKKALEKEHAKKAESEKDLLENIRKTLHRWVQECLARDEKSQKMAEKGQLCCQIQAPWSEGLHQMVKGLVTGYGGRLVVEGQKEGQADSKPAWLARNEKWIIAFDAAAFESYAKKHPEVVDPTESRFREFIKTFISSVEIERMTLGGLKEALEKRFGPLRPTLLGRCPSMAKEEVEARQLRDSKRGSKQQKEEPKIRKTKEEEHRVMILDVKDVEWANATLAPMGLSKDHQPVVRAPASLAGPILSALRNVDAIPHFRETLKTSTLGRTVNAFRSHQNPEISKLAKELVSSWKKVLQRGPSPETRQIRKDNKRRERDEARAEEEEAAKRARGDQPEIKSCTCVWSPSGDRPS